VNPSTLKSDAPVLAAVLALGLEEHSITAGEPVNAYSRVPIDSTNSSDARHVPKIPGYKIVSRLGEGGMGVVWRGVQRSTNREVALKVMSAGRFGSDRARQRFEREIELAARLEHPHIARVYDSGSSGGLWYYAMELVEGQHLDQYVSSNQLDVQQVLALMRDVCQAVHYAHQRGVIHRDIKPSNILVTADGHASVVDFGLAKALEESPHDPTITQEGQYAGTPAFMSPEQASGSHDLIDTRSDVYGLGATLYLLLTDHPPHDQTGPRHEVMWRVANDEVRPPRQMNTGLDVELESLLLKALAYSIGQRYDSAAEMSEDIDRYLSGDPLRAAPPSKSYRMRKFIRKHWVGLSIAAAFVLVLSAATLISVSQAVRARRAEQQVIRERDAAIAPPSRPRSPRRSMSSFTTACWGWSVRTARLRLTRRRTPI
jgi:serine/threonine protein kinase